MRADEFGHRVLLRRKVRGLTQGELAKQVGISRNYVSLIERGEARNVSVNVLQGLAIALGATPAELRGQDGWADTRIPPALRELALREELNFGVVDRLARIPAAGKEPETTEGWKRLYDSVRDFLEEAE